MSRTLVLSSAFVVGLLVACGGPEVRHPYRADDKTPANSTSETRLNGDDPNKPKASTTSATKEDPTQAPPPNKVSDMPKAEDDKPSSGKESAKEKPDKPGAKPSKTGPKITKAECDKAFEKALELEIAGNPQFAGLDKAQLVAMAKQMGAQQHGDAPCDATRSQYTCAMAATSTAAWKRCMQ